MRRAGLAGSMILALFGAPMVGGSPAAADPMKFVVLRGLDKITAHISTFDVPIGQTVKFGGLQITARSCDKRPPEEVPESAAFLEIVEAREGEAPQRLFSGWMFASSPALSALENPIYDLWVLDCKNEASASGATAP